MLLLRGKNRKAGNAGLPSLQHILSPSLPGGSGNFLSLSGVPRDALQQWKKLFHIKNKIYKANLKTGRRNVNIRFYIKIRRSKRTEDAIGTARKLGQHRA